MILIESFHQAVKDIVLAQFEAFRDYKQHPDSAPLPGDVQAKIADFDGVLYHIKQDLRSPTLKVSITLSFFEQIKKYGDSKYLANIYGSYLKSTPEPGTSITLEFNCDSLPDDIEGLARKAASLRRNCFASVFQHFFDYQAANASNPSAKIEQGIINFRADETMFVQAMFDRVTVIFSTRFKDAGDIVLSKVFLQEFSEAKRRFDGAPQVIYQHRDPPKELAGTGAASGENIAYITFVLSPRHITEQKRDRSIDLIHTLRTYMHYHIKCMKAYLQMRMRAKSGEFLKILNRAHPTAADGASAIAYAVKLDANQSRMLSSNPSFRRLGGGS